MITGITHIAVRVTDLERSVKFYSEVLGFPEKFRLVKDDGSPRLVYMQINENQFIELFPNAEGEHVDAKTSALVHVCLQVDDIQKTYEELTAKGLETRGEPIFAIDGSWQFWTSDPDGNGIEFHQFTDKSRQIIG